jgi:hypothetical protein
MTETPITGHRLLDVGRNIQIEQWIGSGTGQETQQIKYTQTFLPIDKNYSQTSNNMSDIAADYLIQNPSLNQVTVQHSAGITETWNYWTNYSTGSTTTVTYSTGGSFTQGGSGSSELYSTDRAGQLTTRTTRNIQTGLLEGQKFEVSADNTRYNSIGYQYRTSPNFAYQQMQTIIRETTLTNNLPVGQRTYVYEHFCYDANNRIAYKVSSNLPFDSTTCTDLTPSLNKQIVAYTYYTTGPETGWLRSTTINDGTSQSFTSCYAYDVYGYVQELRTGKYIGAGDPCAGDLGDQRTEIYEYNAAGWLRSSTIAGIKVVNCYDTQQRGLLVKKIAGPATSNLSCSVTSRSSEISIVQFSYYANGALKGEESALGEVNLYCYD